MYARLAYVPLQEIINACYNQLVDNLGPKTVDRFSDKHGNVNVNIDHFGFIVQQRSWLTEREAFYGIVSKSENYATDEGYVTLGEQSHDSHLMWNGQRLANLALLGNEAWGVTTGYLAITVPDLNVPAYHLAHAGLEHKWDKMYGQTCVSTRLKGGPVPLFRLCVFEQGIQRMRRQLTKVRF